MSLVVVALLFLQMRGMSAFCAVAGTLIGGGSVGSVTGRSVSTYAPFGSLMGYAFWISVSEMNHRAQAALIPAVLLIIGCVWFLQESRRPSFVFAVCVAALLLVVAIANYRNPYDIDGWEPDEVCRSAATSIGVVTLRLMYLCVSFSEGTLFVASEPKRKRPRTAEV